MCSSMTLILIPTTLLAILVLTSVLASVTRQPLSLLPVLTTPLLGLGSGWVPAQLESTVEPSVVEIPVIEGPIRLQLRWRSASATRIASMSPKRLDMPPPPLPHPSQDIPQAQVNARSMKRLSMQLSLQGSNDVKEILSATTMASPESETPLTTPASTRPATPDTNDFLTALAAQERRVLELKEELERAEADLTKLKKQWAVHEATKKRNELRHVEPLRPLKSPKKDTFSSQPATSKSTGEDSRRRAMSIRTKQPQRTVFEGGRHTRTLSLLSPTSLENRSNVSASLNSKVESKNRIPPKKAIPRISTAPLAHSAQQSRGTRDDLVYTGKQFVGDLKDGLFNFIEDLRAATVGDEAISAARSKQIESLHGVALARSSSRNMDQKTPNKASTLPGKKPSTKDSGKAEAAENISPTTIPTLQDTEQHLADDSEVKKAVQTNQSSKASKSESTEAVELEEDDEGWSNWDSPPHKDTASTYSNTALSTPRSSLR